MSLDFPLLGERVLLRPFAPGDAPAAHGIYGDPEVMRYVGAGEAATPDTTEQMIADYRRHQREHGFAFWAVIERSTGRLIGDAGLEVTRFGTELGYTLARDAWGRGLATEAAALCVEAAFGPLGLSRLVALADVENPASSRVLEKLGFRPDAAPDEIATDIGSPDAAAHSWASPPGTVIVYGRPHRRFVRDGPAPGRR
ncbi:GNAT family N-acetyltransferase [Brachybacterium alimentarium]|uniref:GNAT family N-acetyltransferase n=1 Tax=Brachybacterium alimentarium TaxID=47845 RepID=UPI003FD5F271